MKHIRFIRILLWLGSIVIIVTSTPTLRDLLGRRSTVRERQKELEQLIAENKEIERRLAEVQSSEYVERVARDKLGLVREGETIVIVPSPDLKTGSSEPRESLPNWQKWWRLFF